MSRDSALLLIFWVALGGRLFVTSHLNSTITSKCVCFLGSRPLRILLLMCYLVKTEPTWPAALHQRKSERTFVDFVRVALKVGSKHLSHLRWWFLSDVEHAFMHLYVFKHIFSWVVWLVLICPWVWFNVSDQLGSTQLSKGCGNAILYHSRQFLSMDPFCNILFRFYA